MWARPWLCRPSTLSIAALLLELFFPAVDALLNNYASYYGYGSYYGGSSTGGESVGDCLPFYASGASLLTLAVLMCGFLMLSKKGSKKSKMCITMLAGLLFLGGMIPLVIGVTGNCTDSTSDSGGSGGDGGDGGVIDVPIVDCAMIVCDTYCASLDGAVSACSECECPEVSALGDCTPFYASGGALTAIGFMSCFIGVMFSKRNKGKVIACICTCPSLSCFVFVCVSFSLCYFVAANWRRLTLCDVTRLSSVLTYFVVHVVHVVLCAGVYAYVLVDGQLFFSSSAALSSSWLQS